MSTLSIHQFAEKVILVTDGNNKIGRSAALQLALQGAFIIAGSDSGNTESNAALEELRSIGAMANFIKADISSESGKKKLLEDAKDVFGRLDMFVDLIPLGRSDSSQIIAEYAISRNCSKYAAALMDDRPSPRIVTIFTSEFAKETNIRKHLQETGIHDHIESLSKELPSKVRSNAVVVNDSSPQMLFENSDIFRPQGSVSADDAARVVSFLLSSEAKAVNGQILYIS